MVLEYMVTVWDSAEPKTYCHDNVKIYTDWANHYLEKARNKRYISDLQQDVTDGVLLADVIEAVTNEKLQDIKSKPKNSAQMVENINTCLTFLANLGVNIEGLTAKDIRDGNLKAILGLFFSLSRYKQQQKTQQQQHKQEQRAHQGEITDNQGNKSSSQTSAEEAQSRLPCYGKQQSSKCPTIAHPSSKDSRNKSQGSQSASRVRQQNQQNNNNAQGVEVVPDATTAQRASSPAASGIPTPSGRSLVPRSQSATPDKQQNKVPQSSTPVPTSQNKTQSQRSKLLDNKQNSMLDKFKLFNTKEKAKTKGGVPTKGGSKGGSTGSASTSTLSTSSRSDSSYSSSFDAGASSSATSTNDLDSPVSSKPRPIVGGVIPASKRENIGSLTIGQQHSRQSSPSPSPAPVYSSSLPATPVSSLPTSNRKSNLKHRGDGQGKPGADQSRLPQSGSQTFTKGTKVSSLIPKSGGKSQKSSSTLSLSSNSGTPSSQIPALSSSIPMSGSSKGVPKTSSGKSSRSKEEKMRGLSSKESSKEAASHPSHAVSPSQQQSQSRSTPGTQIQTSTLPKKSSKSAGSQSSQLVSPQSQTAPMPQSSQNASTTQAPPIPPHRNGSQSSDKMNGNSLPRQQNSNGSQSQAQTSTQTAQVSRMPVDLSGTPKTRYTEIEYNDGRIERIGDGHFSKPTNQAVATSQSSSNNSPGKSHKDTSHSYLITSQSVNVVKPTCSTPSPSSVKADGNTQTALSVLHTRSEQPPPLPKTEPPPSTRTNISSTNSVQATQNGKPTSPTQKEFSPDSKDTNKQDSGPDANHSTSSSASSTESIVLNTSAANSPRLGIKALGPQMNRQASNVAIVQPHHGEKKETTFDTEVHTDIINKDEKLKNDSVIKTNKENNASDKNTKFVADSGETLDIQPMQPINRSLHYGGYMRGYASPNKPIPLPVSQGQCYAMTSVGGNRIGMNRSLMEFGKIYSSPIKRAMSSGSGNVSFDENNSDYENYDYISGYMSDGDILKKNQMEDMNSGYMSEGGASLYARRLQQRFREGMQAVKECMQKSSGVNDDDSFDDSSSISSGDISDAINEISTDEGNLTAGSGQNDSNPYNSLKRGPNDLLRNLTNAQLRASPGKRVPNLGTSAFLGSDYASDVGGGGTPVHGWRKLSLQNNRLLSSDPADYAYLYSGYEQWRGGNGNVPQEGLGGLRKLSNASQPDIHVHYRSQSTTGDYAGSEKGYPATKCDSETNTDQSHIYEERMRKMQNMQNVQNARQGQSAGVGYGYRRPVSNTSTGSVGSAKSAPGVSGGSPGSPAGKAGSNNVGTRLAKHGLDTIAQQYHTATSKQRQEQSLAAQRQNAANQKDNNNTIPQYSSASLERRGRGGSGKSSSAAQTEMEMYKSNSLGRRKGGIGSRMPIQGDSVSFCGSTIISNPHATYSKPDGSRQNSPYSSVHIPGNISGLINGSHTGHYVPLEYAMGSPRNSGSPGHWIRNNGGVCTADGRQIYHHVSDSESMDALSSANSIQAQIQQARALSGASARILAQSQGYGLQRSNSMKSTHSDYANPQQVQHSAGEDMSQNYSQLPSPPPPTSPTPSNSSHASSRFTYPMMSYGSSPSINPAIQQQIVRSNTSSSLPYNTPLGLTKANGDEEDSLHGSSLSLVSSSSSVYSTAEEKQNHEIRKLRRELESAQQKVSTLTSQLSTNAHVVAAFEQSLSNMTSRLQHLTNTAEQKDSELNELRATIEALKRQSGISIQEPLNNGGSAGRRHTTPGMLGKDLNNSHGRVFHTLPMPTEGRIQRQISSDSMSSINSMSSACSFTSQQSAATDGDLAKKKKKKGWLRSSFSKAFVGKKKNRNGSLSDVELDSNSLRSTLSVPNSPLLQVHMQNGHPLKGSHSSGALSDGEESVTIMELRKQLRDKDMKLTDIRLEALSSAHQLEQLREAMNKMKNDMCALKSDNDRLQRMVQSSQSLNNSQGSLVHHNRTSSESLERTISLSENTSIADLLIQESPDREGRKVPITVYLGSNPDPSRARIDKAAEVPIGSLAVSGKTKWEILDNIVRKIFKEYVLRIDPVTNLGLSAESVFSYHIGDIVRTKDSEVPELLPIGYLVGDTMQIGLCLKGTRQNSVDSLAFETLIPKSIIQRYISLLLEHRRIILCGPSGTGKTYLAQKLAEHLVLRSGKELTAGSVATFNVDHKSAKELRQYLANIADQCENTSMGELPSVIILDNLHHVGSLGEVFNGFLSVKYQKCPYIIGTMNQATCSTTNLQLHHNFRWVLCANHMEPVKGFLGRFLRRRLVEAEVMTSLRNNDLNKIIDWVPKVWLHLNKFLETHSSSDVTIGPRLFLSAPMEIAGSKIWFTDLWNYSIVPYMLEAVREGLQVYGRRAQWEDPADWVLETFPWLLAKEEEQILLKIRPEDVGYDSIGLSSENNSPKIKNKQDKEDIITTDADADHMTSDV